MLTRRALTVSRRWLSTASYETLHVERHDHGVVHVQLNRPDKRNASRSSLRSLREQSLLAFAAALTLPHFLTVVRPARAWPTRDLLPVISQNLTYCALSLCVRPLHCQYLPPLSSATAGRWSSRHFLQHSHPPK